MPITQPCPTCGGSGMQTLGMSFEEAVALAEVLEASKLFHVRALETLTYGPTGAMAWVVRAGHVRSGGTNVTFKGSDFDADYWRTWNPLSHPEQ